MIPQEEKELFCAHLMAAARSLHIGLGRIRMETGFRFVWNDHGNQIQCSSASAEKEALFRACEALQESFEIPWHKPQTRPDSDIHGPLTT